MINFLKSFFTKDEKKINEIIELVQLKELIEWSGSKAVIEIDGGVNDKNAGKLLSAGANALVAGSFVFKSNNPSETIKNLKAVKY